MNIISYAIGLNSGGSKEPVLESISITANGTYTPDAGIDGYNSVSVNVPQEGAPTAEELTFTGNCEYAFSSPAWEWFLNKYGNSITTNQISRSALMFYYSPVSVIPFTIDCNNSGVKTNNSYRMFSNAKKLQVAPNITGSIRGFGLMFEKCENLHSIPDWNNIDFEEIKEDMIKRLEK